MIHVGVTGLRDLSGSDRKVLEAKIRIKLEELRKGQGPTILLDSIADGADQLCAEIGLELGYSLVCPLPFPEYREDFKGESLEQYDFLISKAREVFVVSDCSDRDAAYLAAGKYIVDHCDVLVAIWDGKPQTSSCGTAAVVAYAESLGMKVDILL